MKRKMTRARARFHFRKTGKHRCENPFAVVEAIDDHLIEAQIDGKREAVVGRSTDPVGVRAFLAFFIGTGARMLNETASGAETAITMHGKRGDAAAVII